MNHFISPNYQIEKLDNPTFTDKLDIYNDRIKGWFISPIDSLLKCQNLDDNLMAIFLIELSYFEHIAQLLSGESSKNKSKCFFEIGLRKVIPKVFEVIEENMNPDKNLSSESVKLHEKFFKMLTNGFYSHARCGLYHNASLKYGFMLTNRKGSLIDFEEGLTVPAQIYINPISLKDKILEHHEKYVGRLRNNPVSQEAQDFEKMFDMK